MKRQFGIFILSLMILSCNESTDDLFQKANEFYDKKKYKDAIIAYDQLIKRNNKMQAAFFGRGLCYFNLKEYKKALLDYNMVIWLKTGGSEFVLTLNEDSPFADEEARTQVDYYDAIYQRAKTNYYMDSFKNSFIDFKKLVDINYPEKSNCFLWLGCLWLKSGDTIEACKNFQQAKSTAQSQFDNDEVKKYLKENCN